MKYKITNTNCPPQVPNIVELYDKYFSNVERGYFLEIGAFDGYNWSNTHMLAAVGWQGVMVEPNPEYVKKLMALYPTDDQIRIVQAAIGKENGKCKLYVGGSNSTIIPEMVDVYNRTDWACFSGLAHDKYIDCDMYTIDRVCSLLRIPKIYELLSLDIEGAELDALSGYTIKNNAPTMAIVETHAALDNKELSYKANYIDDYFTLNGYNKIQEDIINTIYVN